WTAMRKVVEKDVQRWKKGVNAPDATVVALEEAALEEAAAAVASTVRAAEAALKLPVSAQRPAKFGSPMAWAIGVALVTLAIVLPFVIAKWNEPKKADYSDLLATQQKAESLAAAGDLPAAHEAYGVLFDTASARPVDDPLVLERLAKAKRDEQRLVTILTEEERRKQQELAGAVVMVAPATAPAKSAATRPAIVVAKALEAVKLLTPATQPVVLRPTTQPIVLRPTTQPIVAAAPTTIPTTMPAIAMVANQPPLPRPPTRRLKVEDEGITDQEIGEAIQRGANFLLTQFNNGHLAGEGFRGDPGLNALCVYALLQCGQAVPDERLNGRAKGMKAMLDNLRNSRMDGYETYGRAIRATALAVYNRAEDRDALKADVQWLINASKNGAYTYGMYGYRNRDFGARWDNSNSQYGLLGVWSGAEVGMEVPRTYWSQVQNHWYETQQESGEWDYDNSSGSGTLSMSVAGIASLFVTHDYLDAPLFGTSVGREPFSRPLARGLAWLEKDDNCLKVTTGWPGYTLYGIERVGLASGFKYFGTHDWYRELAGKLVRMQDESGGWSNRGDMRLRWQVGGREELIETAYSLLFLARGRHPIIMNKLRFAGAWANRPRDLANLSRFASRELERPLNWQVIPIERDWTEWMDSPILYLASHQAPKMSETDIAKLRQFINAGGMLFTQADGGAELFNNFVLELSRKLLPTFEWADLPLDHEIYSLNYRVEPKPRLRCISNGSRILMLHSPQDLSQYWQLRSEKTQRNVFELGVNMFIYAAGKADLRNRLSSSYLPASNQEPSYHVRLARLKYGGLWDPEPGAFPRFAKWFKYQTGYELDLRPIPVAQLDPATFPVVHITGTAAWTPSDAESAVLRRYVSDGGVLLIDACGGAWPFGQSMSNAVLPKVFAGAAMNIVGSEHPLLSGNGEGMENLAKPQLRAYAEQKLGKAAGRIEMYRLGKGRVIYSSIDLTSGLLGTNTWSILGHKPAYAQSFVKNVLLWVADGAVD
ncbi:MAG TPA: DUF4159 domain-containing protein, partial [Tepidisphaeraceae bacterium]|nr:DUF4159 domain-containing protein [Tepidisphaeraceae bacterium]